jgi:uncharacterized protein DUF3562
LLDLRVFRGAGVVSVMVRQDLRRVITRPVGENSRTPLPLEVEVIVGRICREAEGRFAASGKIGIYRHGLAVEENLVTEIVRVYRRGPAPRRVESTSRPSFLFRGGYVTLRSQGGKSTPFRQDRMIRSTLETIELADRHRVAIQTLAERSHSPFALVEKMYRNELSQLESPARVTRYSPLVGSRRVRDLLRQSPRRTYSTT